MDAERKKRLRSLLEEELPDSVSSFDDEDLEVLLKKKYTSKDAFLYTELSDLAKEPHPLHPTLIQLFEKYRGRAGEAVLPYAEYSSTPLTFNSFKFDASIPEILFPQSELLFLKLPLVGIDFIKPALNGQAPHAIHRECSQFLENKKMGKSEDALHGRDDNIFKVMQTVCPSLKVATRNTKTNGSVGDTRLDLTLAEEGKPPSVLCEEKDREGELGVAENELQSKWAPVPQYGTVPFIPGVAIAGDKVRMNLLSRQGGVEGHTLELDLASRADRIRCLKAAVNVARLCAHIHEQDLLEAVRFDFNVVHHLVDKSILLSLTSVRKVYLKMEEAAAAMLTKFYSDTRYVRYVEKGEAKDDAIQGFAYKLTPVGWEHRPTTLPTLVVAIKCILLALKECHELGWTINDIRWANIISVAEEWYLIDCEYARPVGHLLPQLKIRPPGQFCSAASDLFMVHRLLSDVYHLFKDDAGLQQLHTLIASDQSRSATSAAKLLELPCMEAVSSPPLSPSHA